MATPPKNRGKCFVIMPITVPSSHIGKYADGTTHFANVLHHLFEPAIRRAGFDVIPPIAKGSDIIHVGIIRSLENADLVLCDMSTLNANVFFEWGVRCALNRPVCVVQDDLTDERPFDVAMLNSHTYHSNPLWDLSGEIDALNEHIEETLKGEPGNSLWRRFGFQLAAEPARGRPGEKDQLAILSSEVAALRREVTTPKPPTDHRSTFEAAAGRVESMAKQLGLNWCYVVLEKPRVLRVTTEDKLSQQQEMALVAVAAPNGYSIIFDQDSPYQGR